MSLGETPDQPMKDSLLDMQHALFLLTHIAKPCGDSDGNNIRSLYIREARRAIALMQNGNAIALLQNTINDYPTL